MLPYRVRFVQSSRVEAQHAMSNLPAGPRVDGGLHEARQRLAVAATEEQFQAVGLICRETLISLAQTVFDAERHPTLDGVTASDTDVKRMLGAFITRTLSGGANDASRRHAIGSSRFSEPITTQARGDLPGRCPLRRSNYLCRQPNRHNSWPTRSSSPYLLFRYEVSDRESSPNE
jgi:hypothetical protein